MQRSLAIITGATKGIGKAIAEKFLSEGCNLAICARHEKDLKAIKEAWQQQYPQQEVFTQRVDMGIQEEVFLFAENILTTFNRIDCLVNNAGIFYPGSILNEPENQLENLLHTNLLSAYHLTRKIAPQMIAQQSGHIFNMCSVASLKAYPNGGSYSISKYALLGFSANLREELKTEGVKVTSVCPGAVWTDSWSGSGVAEERLMPSKDIAQLIWNAFQLSPQTVVEDIIVRPQLGDL